MTPLKFIHAADLHIDSPLRGLDSYEGAPVERIRGATRGALAAMVDLALQEQVHFVLLAGDIYDGSWSDFRTGLYFRQEMVRMTRTGIKVFVVKGNHDAESLITQKLPAVDGVHVFSSRKCETLDLPEWKVAIHGRSYPERAVTEDLVTHYPSATPGRFNIGLLHTSLAGYVEHQPYAPTSVAALSAKGYDYFALGHVHTRQVVQEAGPRIVFPGNLQGRHARETGPKGCELVSVVDGAIHAEFVPLDRVRWHQLVLEASGLESVDALATTFRTGMTPLAQDARDRLHAVRVIVQGQSSLHRVEAQQPGTLAAAIQAAAQDVDGADVWIEEVRLDLRTPFDRSAAIARADAMGEVVRLSNELTSDPANLRDWIRDQLSDFPKLRHDLADLDPAQLKDEDLLAALADAEATVLAQLSEAMAEGGKA